MTRIITLIMLLTAARAHAQPTTAPATQPFDRGALERQFEQTMSGARMVGYSTDTRRPDAPPRQDGYTIDKVTKLPGNNDNWMFTARIPFGDAELAVPLVIPVRWAGDTPVISVTDLTVPKMGTYTARVLIYRDTYVGTWFGRDHGGQLWGRIERPAPTTAPATGQVNH
jgi:hypothetical protein